MNDEQDLLKKTFKSKEIDSTRLGTESRAPSIQEIIQHYLPETEWLDESRGRCPCPGRHLHTTRSTKNDCMVFIGGSVPTVYCLHDNCRGEVAAVNSDIRAAFNLFQPELDTEAMSIAKAKAAARHALEAKAKASLPEILKQYRWDVADLTTYRLNRDTEDFLSKMFGEADVIWIGNPEDSGRPEHTTHFSRQFDFIMASRLYGSTLGRYTTASTYKAGSYSRSNANVETTRYMIVECDKVLGEPTTEEQKLANKNACGAITRWLVESVGLTLRAVVDSGSKSLHSWMDMPSRDKFEELKIVLPQLGADRAMFKPSQPARLAGAIRENGKEQKLLYLK